MQIRIGFWVRGILLPQPFLELLVGQVENVIFRDKPLPPSPPSALATGTCSMRYPSTSCCRQSSLGPRFLVPVSYWA